MDVSPLLYLHVKLSIWVPRIGMEPFFPICVQQLSLWGWLDPLS